MSQTLGELSPGENHESRPENCPQKSSLETESQGWLPITIRQLIYVAPKKSSELGEKEAVSLEDVRLPKITPSCPISDGSANSGSQSGKLHLCPLLNYSIVPDDQMLFIFYMSYLKPSGSITAGGTKVTELLYWDPVNLICG